MKVLFIYAKYEQRIDMLLSDLQSVSMILKIFTLDKLVSDLPVDHVQQRISIHVA